MTQSSTVVIQGSGYYGMMLYQSEYVTLSDVTLTDFATDIETALYATEVLNLTMSHVSIVNAPGSGALIENCYNLFITDSSFLSSGLTFALEQPVDPISNLFIWYYNNTETSYPASVHIARSNISHGRGAGLYIFGQSCNPAHLFRLTIDHTTISANAFTNAYIDFTDCHYSAVITNSLITDGTNGSMIVKFDSEHPFAIESTQFLRNTADLSPLLIVWLGRETSTEILLIKNCTIANNIGSGILIIPFNTSCLTCSQPTFSLVDVLIADNEAIDFELIYRGGAIMVDHSDLILDNVTVRNSPCSGGRLLLCQ